MNDTPGWASPGSAPSDGQGSGAPHQVEPVGESGPASTWSKEQPPPGQWSAPTAQDAPRTPAPPPGGWGGGQPRGGWGQPPAAAKPGVIPLRPLGVGEILDGAVSTLRAHWRTVLGVTIAVSVISEICNILVERYVLPDPPEVDPDASPSETLRQSVDSLQSSLLGLGPALVITLVATLFTTALLTVVISRSVLGSPVTLSDAWHEARPRLLQLLGLTLLLPLMSAGIMTAAVLPGLLLGGGWGIALSVMAGLAACAVILWLMIRFALASPALMLERQGVIASLRRSAKLVQGAWWRTLGILALTLLLTLLVSMIIAIPFSLIAFAVDGSGFSDLFSGENPDFGWPFLIITGIGSVIASSITYPISAGVTVLLYVDQRIRREALDLELARAAGVPGYGSQPSGHDSFRS
ncbi:hypothetical protein [Streptomyces sp. NBC_00829]|uniref:DUF7544 domain-containing protein n=1 Tax=Streptomyces sp. NBC_00829 TaxID=2903679 RepID=UPI003864A7D8|nr:hypothetical protein OG293_22005 [Streptomyces sp. NBC_00829]